MYPYVYHFVCCHTELICMLFSLTCSTVEFEPNTEFATPQACESLEKFSMVAERCTRDSLCLSEAVLGARTQAPTVRSEQSRHVSDKSCWVLELRFPQRCEVPRTLVLLVLTTVSAAGSCRRG